MICNVQYVVCLVVYSAVYDVLQSQVFTGRSFIMRSIPSHTLIAHFLRVFAHTVHSSAKKFKHKELHKLKGNT